MGNTFRGKSTVNKLFIISAIVGLTGCFSAKLLTPTQSDVDRVNTKYSNYTLADLNRGKTLYEANCGNCHGLKNPSSRTEDQWKEIVPRMSKKVNKSSIVLDEKAQQDILRYVVTMSTAPQTK